MAVKMTGAFVPFQPVLDEAGTAGRVTRLEETVDPLMRRVGITRVAGERAFDQAGAGRDLSGLDVGPAEIAEKPPILAPMWRQFFEQLELSLVMIAPSTEAQ